MSRGLLHRHEDRELGDDGLAGTGRRRDQHALALLEHVARGELERVEVEALALAERLEQRGGSVAFAAANRSAGESWSVTSGPAVRRGELGFG